MIENFLIFVIEWFKSLFRSKVNLVSIEDDTIQKPMAIPRALSNYRKIVPPHNMRKRTKGRPKIQFINNKPIFHQI